MLALECLKLLGGALGYKEFPYAKGRFRLTLVSGNSLHFLLFVLLRTADLHLFKSQLLFLCFDSRLCFRVGVVNDS